MGIQDMPTDHSSDEIKGPGETLSWLHQNGRRMQSKYYNRGLQKWQQTFVYTTSVFWN